MKKALFIFSIFAIAASCRAQSNSPWTRINSPADGSVFSAKATVSVGGEAVIPIPDHFNSVVTNLSLFSNGSLIASQSGPSTTITANMSSLAGGTYVLSIVAKGTQTLADQSEQGWSAVSEPVKIAVDPTYEGPPYVGGKIEFRNRFIPTSQPNSALPGYVPGGNGNGTYNVPIYQGDGSGHSGAGLLPGGVTVGLFEAGSLIPLVTSLLRTDTPANAAFFATSTQTATTHSPVGSTPILIIRAWPTSAGSFVAAVSNPGALWREWQFISPPLGGTPQDGSNIPTPSVTGWGPQDGSGLSMFYEPEFPRVRITSPTNGSIFAAPAAVSVSVEPILPDFVLTNLALFANGTLLSSQSGSGPLSTPPLAAGSYNLMIFAGAYYAPSGQLASGLFFSDPVNITVVEPVEMSIAPPQIVSGEFQFNYAANPGLKYVIKTSADLLDWQSIATNIPSVNPALFTQPFDTGAARYYKVERVPNP